MPIFLIGLAIANNSMYFCMDATKDLHTLFRVKQYLVRIFINVKIALKTIPFCI